MYVIQNGRPTFLRSDFITRVSAASIIFNNTVNLDQSSSDVRQLLNEFNDLLEAI